MAEKKIYPLTHTFYCYRSEWETIMAEIATKDNILQPTSLHEAINIIKFLKTSHKQEITKLKEAYAKQADFIKKLESNRKQELEFLSGELQKYEASLAIRTESVAKQLAQKDIIIQKQAEVIEELNKKLLNNEFAFSVPEIHILADSNSDSGIVLDNDESSKIEEKTEVKATRKCSRKFGETISFLRSRVDFSPMKYKPSNPKKKEDKKSLLQLPVQSCRMLCRQMSHENAKISMSDEDKTHSEDAIHSDSGIEPVFIRPKLSDSMNNHFSDDGSEDTSEEIFDRVMTRSSVRRSVKANPKYKKINRSKSKLLDQVKMNIVD